MKKCKKERRTIEKFSIVIIMKYINRIIEEKIEKVVNLYSVIMISGPRQSGKSTVLEYVLKEKKATYVTLDDLKLRSLAQEDPELFLRTYQTPLIIDEFQYAPKLLSYIKIIVDNERKKALFNNQENETLFYLTGSQIFKTMDIATESLAGRVGIFDLYPLSLREIKRNKISEFIPNIDYIKSREKIEIGNIIDIYNSILRGGYPLLHQNSKLDIESFFSNYIKTYIERDIRSLLKVQDENKFLSFVTYIAAITGNELVKENIGNELGIDAKTVDNWISILKNSGIIYLLRPYSNNNLSKAVKRPKVYFMDTGLACYLTGYSNADILSKSAYSGAIFETYVITEIIKSYTNNGIDTTNKLYYYRDTNGKEIDLLIINNNVMYPIEIKKSANPNISAIKNFDIVDKTSYDKKNGIVLCLSSNIYAYNDQNFQVPIEYI